MTIKINPAYVILILIIGGLAYWFFQGMQNAPVPEVPDVSERVQVQARPVVTVEQLPTERIERVLELSARTEEFRKVTVRSEIAGRVIRLPVSKGNNVRSGEVLVELDADDLNARLKQNKAEVDFKTIEFEAEQRLLAQQLTSRSKLAQSASGLELARADLESTTLQLSKTKVSAPFAGVLEELDVELGSYLGAGEAIGTIYQYDPMLVVAYVNESDVNKLKTDMSARVVLIDGTEVRGKVKFIANSGEADARTYRVEIAIANQFRQAKAQMSATAFIEFTPVNAIKISPSILSLDAEGNIGVKTVSEDMLVQHQTVQLERMQTNDFWVSGLPANARVVTIGHGFVEPGDRVDAYWPSGERVGRADN